MDVWSALGYDTVAAAVAKALHTSNEIVVIEGPPGVGKSWLAKGIGALWQDGGGSTILAEGDLLRSDVVLYPFGFAMAGLSSGWRSMLPAASGIARAGETLLGTAGLITSTVETLAIGRRSRRRHRTLYLGDAEQDVLHELGTLGRKRPILLIADNLHWWDALSLDLLSRLREPPMVDAFPFLAEMRLVGVQTPPAYQMVAHPAARDAFLAPGTTRVFELARVPREGFEGVLQGLGAGPALTPELTDVIYALSGGHLALASRCAARVAEGEADDFVSAADMGEFVRALLSERIWSLGTLGREAVALLEIAAVAGLTFRRDEVVCAAGTDEAATLRLLRACRDEQLVELTDGLGRFVHELYHRHFLAGAAPNGVAIADRLGDCLRLLRPAEYELRCRNAIDAERPREAAALAIQSGLQRERDGGSWTDLPPAVADALEHGAARRVMERLAEAAGHLKHYRFAECLAALDALPRDLAKPIAGEAEYLRAMCLMSTRSEDDRAIGRSLLQAWMGYEIEQPELGIRLMMLLLYGLSHLLDKEPGRALEGRVRQALIDRVSFDTAARDALYVLDRSSSSLYQPDISLARKREAVAYFARSEEDAVLRRPLEYYRCLVNYGAGLISNARYAEAHEVFEDVAALAADYPPGAFPRPDYPRMNGLLAAYRVGIIGADQAARRQAEIVSIVGATNDPFYAENALAVYLALAGRHDEALALFNRLHERIASRSNLEPSMEYLLGANRCLARFAAGDRADCATDWAALDTTVRRIAYVIRPILIRRHELLGGVIAAGLALSAVEIDVCLVTRGELEFGPLWDNFGRGFRMPEVEFWREN